jgi:hypothetical protein
VGCYDADMVSTSPIMSLTSVREYSAAEERTREADGFFLRVTGRLPRLRAE